MMAAMLLATTSMTHDALKLPTFIASSMALQRAPLSARLWGWAPAGTKVTATLDGNTTVTATTAAAGNWSLDLPPQPAGTGHSIVITAAAAKITLTDIAFGDVYLCSGQSNMQFSVNTAFNASAEIAASSAFGDIRLATVKLTVSDTPQYDVASAANYSWARASPAAFVPVGGHTFSWFSATCWFAGRDVYTALGGKVPIGLVASDWGGQRVEAFSSPDALHDRTCGGTRPAAEGAEAADKLVEAVDDNDDDTGSSADDTHSPWRASGMPNPGPTQLWNAMIHPLLPMRFLAALWYQGEANAGDPSGYACRFPA